MKPLLVPATDDTPKIDFNPESGELEIVGNSYPENSAQFYTPVIEWLTGYLSFPPEQVVFHFNFDYFNTSSAKFVLEILRILEIHYENGVKCLIKWHYYVDDIDVLESGEDYQSIVSLPFELVERDDTL